MKIFVTSDTHFGHNNIIKYCNRPFKFAKEMDETIIKNYNSVVSNQDHVYFLGDFSMSNNIEYLNYIFHRLNGTKFLIKGNHDAKQSFTLPWKWIKDYHELYYKDVLFCMMHYPIKIWNKKHHGSICLGGHSHLKVNEFKERYMDVGVDGNSYFPVDIDIIIDKMFVIDYFIYSSEKRIIKTHLTYASSRKNAEFNTRNMESPDRINIIKITPIIIDSISDSIINDAIVAHIHSDKYVDNRDADESTYY